MLEMFRIITFNLNEEYEDLFEREHLILPDTYKLNDLPEKLVEILNLYNDVVKKHVKIYINEYYSKKYNNIRHKTFRMFSISRFNLMLSELQEKFKHMQELEKDEDEWIHIFIHWFRDKAMLMKNFIEYVCRDNKLTKKMKMINIIRLYKLGACFVTEDIQFMQKDRMHQIIRYKKKMINESIVND